MHFDDIEGLKYLLEKYGCKEIFNTIAVLLEDHEIPACKDVELQRVLELADLAGRVC